MQRFRMTAAALALICAGVAPGAFAQSNATPPAAAPAQPPAPYGAPIQLAQARQAMDAALAEARRTNVNVAVAVVDGGGHLIAFSRMDGASTASVDISIGKARTAAAMRAPSAMLEGWAAASSAPAAIPGLMPMRGGFPIIIDGRIAGAIGVSGSTPTDDERLATAGLAALQRR